MAVHGFNANDARRVAAATRYVESHFRGGAPGRARGPVIVGTGMRLAQSPSGGIAAISGTTMTGGTVTYYERSGTTLATGSATGTAYNPFPEAVPASVKVLVGADSLILGWWC